MRALQALQLRPWSHAVYIALLCSIAGLRSVEDWPTKKTFCCSRVYIATQKMHVGPMYSFFPSLFRGMSVSILRSDQQTVHVLQ